MSDSTILRLDVDSDVLRRAGRVVPGVEVPDGDDGAPPMSPEPAADEGLGERLRSLWDDWGLLGVGVSLVGAGAATAGFWWYRRRNRTPETEFDPSPADALGDTAPHSAVDVGPTSTDVGPGTVPNPDGSPGSTAVETAETSGAAEQSTETDTAETAAASDDHEDTDVTERDDTETDTQSDEDGTAEPPSTEPEIDVDLDDASDADGGDIESDTDLDDTEPDGEGDEEDPSRAGGSLEKGPLLGVAFLALTGAVVRWLRGDRS